MRRDRDVEISKDARTMATMGAMDTMGAVLGDVETPMQQAEPPGRAALDR
jgi:hypothetical protein